MNPATVHLWSAASQHFAAGQLNAAYELVRAVVQLDPEDAAAWLALAQIDLRFGRIRLAERNALAALQSPTDNADLLCAVNDVLFTTGSAEAARRGAERLATMRIDSASTAAHVGLQHQSLGCHAAALAWLERAHKVEPKNPVINFLLAVQLTFHGRLRDAESLLETCAGIDPPVGRAMAQLSQLRTQTNDRNHLSRLAAQLRSVAVGSEDHAALEFARYKELEDLGRYAEAWDSLVSANAAMHGLSNYDAAAEQRTFDRLARQVATLPWPSVADSDDAPVPIFIVGLPRSGTTLLDRMLGNHSEVCSAGELGTFWRGLQWAVDRFSSPMLDESMVARLANVDWEQIGNRYMANAGWRASGRRFFIDKMPRNWLLAPLIQRALPRARILHMVRAPMDVAFSNYRCYFGGDYPYSYGIESVAGHYCRYRKIMAQWHRMMPNMILDVSYRDLVASPDAALRRVFDYCGLAWEPGCADLSANHQPVATLSAAQVRGSVKANLMRRWTPYAEHLTGLRELLGSVEAENA